MPRIKQGVHSSEIQRLDILRSGGGGDGEQEMVTRRVGLGVGVEGVPAGLQELDEVLRFGGGGGVFPVDVEAVEGPVCC